MSVQVRRPPPLNRTCAVSLQSLLTELTQCIRECLAARGRIGHRDRPRLRKRRGGILEPLLGAHQASLAFGEEQGAIELGKQIADRRVVTSDRLPAGYQ